MARIVVGRFESGSSSLDHRVLLGNIDDKCGLFVGTIFILRNSRSIAGSQDTAVNFGPYTAEVNNFSAYHTLTDLYI